MNHSCIPLCQCVSSGCLHHPFFIPPFGFSFLPSSPYSTTVGVEALRKFWTTYAFFMGTALCFSYIPFLRILTSVFSDLFPLTNSLCFRAGKLQQRGKGEDWRLWVLSCSSRPWIQSSQQRATIFCQCDQYGSQAYSYRQEDDIFAGMWNSESTKTVHVLKFDEFDWMFKVIHICICKKGKVLIWQF